MSEQPPPGPVPPAWVPPGSATPGAVPPSVPGGAPAGWGPPGPPPGLGPYGYPVPAYKPGVVALRPLGLGDLYDGALKTIRRNPGAMVGLAALVSTAFLVLPAIAALVLAATGNMSTNGSGGSGVLGPGFAEASPVIATGASGVLGWLSTVVLNGMIVHVVAEAVVGRKSTIGEAWAATRGRLPRLLGLTVLNGLVLVLLVGIPVGLAFVLWTFSHAAGVIFGILGVLAALVLVAFVQVRVFQLAAPTLVLERIGVFAALRRSFALTRAQFWRLFGIILLTGLVVGIVGNVVGVPFSVAGALGPELVSSGAAGALVAVFASYLSQILVSMVTTPFSSAVVALQYVDQRIRKEGFDVALMAASQQTAPTPR